MCKVTEVQTTPKTIAEKMDCTIHSGNYDFELWKLKNEVELIQKFFSDFVKRICKLCLLFIKLKVKQLIILELKN